jgi:hypothetical protein
MPTVMNRTSRGRERGEPRLVLEMRHVRSISTSGRVLSSVVQLRPRSRDLVTYPDEGTRGDGKHRRGPLARLAPEIRSPSRQRRPPRAPTASMIAAPATTFGVRKNSTVGMFDSRGCLNLRSHVPVLAEVPNLRTDALVYTSVPGASNRKAQRRRRIRPGLRRRRAPQDPDSYTNLAIVPAISLKFRLAQGGISSGA